jgi:hypothetical protein
MEKRYLLTTYQFFFLHLMLLLFLSLASIIWVACLRSCQPTSSVPPSSGCAEAAMSPLSSAPTTSCAGDPLLHHLSPVEGRGRLRQPPEGLQGRGRYTWQSATPWQTARPLTIQPPPTQAVQLLPSRSCFRPAGFFIFNWGAARRHSTLRGVFVHPGLAAPSLPAQIRYPQ